MEIIIEWNGIMPSRPPLGMRGLGRIIWKIEGRGAEQGGHPQKVAPLPLGSMGGELNLDP